jgi:hypothetical protein
MKSEQERRQDWEQMRWKMEESQRRTPEARQKLGSKANLGQKATQLTGSPEWDWLVSHIQELHAKRQLELNGVMASFVRPAGMGTEHLRSLREQALRLDAELDLLQHLMELPEKIIRDGKSAMDEIKALEKVTD